jgi:tRNA 5-methylaminomethyl-2-thiouridine biosynthesis bifunctional protein
MPRLPPTPELIWSDEGVPRAADYDDVYFSKAGGLAESDAVFLAGCGLPERWRGRAHFAICELGFGSGLNALAVWRAWKRTREPHAILHMCSVEAVPLAREDAARALAAFPEVSERAAALIARWPVRACAPQRLWFPDDGFALTLLTGEAARVLADVRGAFDAFFFDGFAPSRNPQMWSADVMREIARLSAEGARLATFSVAGEVRRNLEAAGFAVERKPGFGAKRERLEAWRDKTLSLVEGAARDSAPHPLTPSPQGRTGNVLYPYASCDPKRVAIIGAGIAGASCAHALAKRGVECIVFDAARELGAGASGNPAGLVMPRLDRGGALAEFFLAAYLEATATYERLGVFERCGVIERAGGERDAAALADLLDDPPLPEDWFARRGDDALHVRAGLARPVGALEAMLCDATLMLDAEVAAIEAAGEAWIVRAGDGRALLKADAVVLACGAALKAFGPASFLPLELTRGQIEWGPCAAAPAHALTCGSYVAPFADGVLFGATFEKLGAPGAPAPSPALVELGDGDAVEAPALQRRAANIEALTKIAPEIAARIDASALQSRAAMRAATPDRAPVAGLLPDAARWLKLNAAIVKGGEGHANSAQAAHRGVYVLGGLGARGLTLAPILGERIAAEMFGEPQALSSACLDLLHPARFLHRALKRGG